MSWITLTTDDIETRLTKPELAALTTAARQDDQTASGILAGAITAVTAEVRGYVAACKNNILGESGTIPDELESAALSLIRRHLFTRLPGMASLYDQLRQDETRDAIERLRDTAACKFAIVPPTTPAAESEQAAGPSHQLVSSRIRVGKPSDLAGL